MSPHKIKKDPPNITIALNKGLNIGLSNNRRFLCLSIQRGSRHANHYFFVLIERPTKAIETLVGSACLKTDRTGTIVIGKVLLCCIPAQKHYFKDVE